MPSRGTRRVAMLTPFAFPSPSGNAVTVERIASGLSARGMEPRVWDLSAGDAATVEREVCQWRPDLVHAFHAFHAGPLGARVARLLGLPLVVTLTGTDANHDLADAQRGPTVREVLEGAAAITVFHRSIGARVSAARHEGFELHYVGPVLDAAEGAKLFLGLAGRPWCRYLGAVPHARMPALLRAADVVLNCSISEGGMSNSVLEALTLGRPVLASDIEGNRALIEDGVTGLLFSDASELASQAVRLLDDVELRARLGAEGQSRAAGFRPEAEIDGYVRLFDTLVPAS